MVKIRGEFPLSPIRGWVTFNNTISCDVSFAQNVRQCRKTVTIFLENLHSLALPGSQETKNYIDEFCLYHEIDAILKVLQ